MNKGAMPYTEVSSSITLFFNHLHINMIAKFNRITFMEGTNKIKKNITLTQFHTSGIKSEYTFRLPTEFTQQCKH